MCHFVRFHSCGTPPVKLLKMPTAFVSKFVFLFALVLSGIVPYPDPALSFLPHLSLHIPSVLVSGGSRDSSVNVVTRLRTGRPRFDSWENMEVFLYAAAPRSALRPTQLPFRGWSGRYVKLTTRLYLVPRLRMHGVIPPLPHASLNTWYLYGTVLSWA
jgi:hypothetical protein